MHGDLATAKADLLASIAFAFPQPHRSSMLIPVDMDRVVKKSRSFAEAEAWERQQYLCMTPRERMRAARQIKDRLFHGRQADVRACHTSKKAA